VEGQTERKGAQKTPPKLINAYGIEYVIGIDL